jgi:hypothetical protein
MAPRLEAIPPGRSREYATHMPPRLFGPGAAYHLQSTGFELPPSAARFIGRDSSADVAGAGPWRRSMSEIVDFVCPGCTSRYKLVRVHRARAVRAD